MKIRIEVETDNAAFDDPGELESVLQKIALGLRECELHSWATARDTNGNVVAWARVECDNVRDSFKQGMK